MQEFNVIAISKSGEKYLFLYDDDSVPEVLQVLDYFVAEAELNFTNRDAQVVYKEVRRLQKERCCG